MFNDLAGGYFGFPSQWVYTFDRFNLVALPVIGFILLVIFDSSSHIHWCLDVSFTLSYTERLLVDRWILGIKACFIIFTALRIQKCALDVKRLIFTQSIPDLLSLGSSLPGFFLDWGI